MKKIISYEIYVYNFTCTVNCSTFVIYHKMKSQGVI